MFCSKPFHVLTFHVTITSNCSSGLFGCDKTCGGGFIRNALGACEDVDECLESPCGANQVCVNGEGGYSCDCTDGFDLLVDVCVSETCDNFPSICAEGEECVSVAGGDRIMIPASIHRVHFILFNLYVY